MIGQVIGTSYGPTEVPYVRRFDDGSAEMGFEMKMDLVGPSKYAEQVYIGHPVTARDVWYNTMVYSKLKQKQHSGEWNGTIIVEK